ncbi:MAG: HU family DNA-binding protein [Gammaproteobacteria bacterium]
MSLGKKDIIKNITSEAHISPQTSQLILNKFIHLICDSSFIKPIKISNFGTFFIHKTPKRIGRNPITREEFAIEKRLKLTLKVSNYVRNFLNK